jgi:Big-like domain-containing protein
VLLKRAAISTLCILILVGVATTAAQPVITALTIPFVSMNIGDVVTTTIFVESDTALYTLNASTIGGYPLSNLSKLDPTTYIAEFTITSGGNDYAEGDDIPTDVTLADVGLTATWNTDISQANDPIDANRPNVTINQKGGQADPTNTSPVVFTAVFDEPINDATFTDAHVNVGGTATIGTVTVIEVSPNDDTTFEVSIVVTADGTVVPTIPAGGVEDVAGNTNNVSTSTDNSVTIDVTKPDVTINQSGGQADPTSGSPVFFTVVFDESINDATFTSVDVSVGGTATAGTVTVTEIAPNDDTTFSVSIVVIADGTVIPTISAGVVEDYLGNTNTVSTSANNSVTLDTIKPDVTIDQAGGQTDPTNASPVLFIAVFDEPINDATFTDVDVTVGGTATTGDVTVTEIAPNDDTTFQVSIVVASDGTVVPTIPAGGVEDLASNTNTVSTSTGNSVTVETVKPDVTITQKGSQADPTNTSPVVFTAVFDEPINDGTFTNFDVNAGGTATTGTVSVIEVAPNDDTTFEVSIVVTADGTVVPTIPAGGVEDPAGNTNNISTSSDNSVTVDTDAPGIDDVEVDTALMYDGDLIQQVTVFFDEAMDTAIDPTITFGAGTFASNSDGAWSVGDTVWIETFNLTDNNEEITVVTIDITDTYDVVGNNQTAYAEIDEFDVDTLNPTVTSLTLDDPSPTAAAQVYFDLVFSESVSGVATGNFSITDPAGTGGQTSAFVDSVGLTGGAAWWVLLNTVDDATGTLSIDLDSSLASITDDAGNELVVAYGTDEVYVVDRLDPTVTDVSVSDLLISEADAGGTFTVTVVFDDNMNPAQDPTITFNPAVGSTLAITSDSWPATDTYAAVYNVSDGNVELNDVTIDVTAAEDDLENLQTDYTPEAEFSIDTVKPTVTVDIVDMSLSDFDNSSTVTFEFSEDVANFTIDDLTPTNGTLSSFVTIDADSYTVLFTATDGIEATGSVAVGAGLYTDLAGNNGTAGSDTVTIDTLNPTVTGIIANDTWITDEDTPGDRTFMIQIAFSEPMNQSVRPTLLFDRNLDSTLMLDTSPGAWSTATTYQAYYDVADGNAEAEDVRVDVEDAEDVSGNPLQEYTPGSKTFDVDTENPSVTVVFTDALLSDADAESLVTITFSEPVNNFTIDDLTPTNGTLTSFTNVDLATWTVIFTAVNGLDRTGTVAVGTGYEDYRSNSPNSGDSGTVDIDTKNPTVVSVEVDTDPLYEGSLTQVVTVTFSEPMDTASASEPTVSFSAGSYGYPEDGVWSVNNTVWTETMFLTDNNEDIVGVFVSVTGAKDAAGNYQVPYSDEAFDIDTIKPSVSAVDVSDLVISDADASGTFTVTISFNEKMDPGIAPTIQFSPSIDSTLSLSGGLWNLDADSYQATYNVSDAGIDEDNVTIDVIGAKDEAGNDQKNYTPENEFEIDTFNPSVTGVSTSDSLITDDNTPGDGTFVVTIEFSEAMNAGVAPTVSFSPTVATTLSLDGTSGWLDSDTYEAKYDTADGNVDHDTIQIDVTGTQDAAGNAQLNYTPQNEFGIDTVNPTVTAVAVDDTLLSDSDAGTPFTVTVDFSEPMTDDGSTDPTLTFVPAVGSTLAFASDSWPTATRYQAIYTISDAGVDHDSVTIDVTLADDENGNLQQDYTPEGEFAIDTLNPTVTVAGVTLSDNLITDADVGNTFTVTIDYSEPMLSTAPSLAFSPNLDTTLSFQAGSSGWQTTQQYVASYTILDGNTTVLDDDITITNAQDLAGNVQVAENYDDQLDVDTENPTFHDFTVRGGAVDANCLRVVTFTAKVTDPNGTMVPGDISVTAASVTNTAAGIVAGDVYDISQTSDNATTITITGKVDVEDLTGCPARVTITLDAVDSVDNDATQQAQSDDVVDTTIPTIDDLRFDMDGTHATEQTVPYLVDDCGHVVIYFSATINDNCCIVPGNVIVTVTLPTADAILESIVINRVQAQNDQGQVDVTGEAVVRCLDGPDMSRVQVNMTAVDCCGNVATPVVTGTGEGLVDDIILPIPKDDPRQDMVMDESAVIDPLVEVRIDEFGTYRLILRESTPVRIDIMGNDADNLSHNVAHPFGPCIACGPCGGQTGCCAVMYIEDIVKHPSYGTATIEDDTGDCAGGTVIRYAPDRGYLGPDYFTYRTRDAFGNISSVIATVYLQTVPEVWMEDVFAIACEGETVEFTVSAADLFIDPTDPSIIQFAFSVADGPEHGIIGGSLLDVFYTPASQVTDPQFGVLVPSLDFSEAAAVTLTYTPADGFTGIDAIRVRFEDPFGGVAHAVVNITVGQCGNTSGAGKSVLRVNQGERVALIVPSSFESIFAVGWGDVTLVSLENGQVYDELITVEWSQQVNRHILAINTEGLPVGSYKLTIPLGTGETVTLTIEVGEAT